MVILEQAHLLQRLRKETTYSSVMMPTMNAFLLGMLATTFWKEEVMHTPTMMPMMNVINFH
jgi:hypothetical protein